MDPCEQLLRRALEARGLLARPPGARERWGIMLLHRALRPGHLAVRQTEYSRRGLTTGYGAQDRPKPPIVAVDQRYCPTSTGLTICARNKRLCAGGSVGVLITLGS